ncbi:hypothetical protein EUGRSUZ_A00489 [Eucalyptus grandis]|uniref:Uncharacterized protein n=2 Tax=Eucalyptus grandis TaxID=71139 RepID=A0ACC3KHC5_EUCGR|nr:hypothetical protein EUGRSUZ_A00489 [Eucalyptus grandis]
MRYKATICIKVMIQKLMRSFYEAQAREFIQKAKELLKFCEAIPRVYVQRTCKPFSTEAHAHGIVDLIAID